jgi:hypothetical protein
MFFVWVEPCVHSYADPDPAYQNNADPNPDLQPWIKLDLNWTFKSCASQIVNNDNIIADLHNDAHIGTVLFEEVGRLTFVWVEFIVGEVLVFAVDIV